MTKEELARVISDTKRELGDSGDPDGDGENDDDDDDDDAAMETSEDGKCRRSKWIESIAPKSHSSLNSTVPVSSASRSNPDDEYNFDAYDTEHANQVAAISDIATVESDEGENVSDGEDSEAEDDKIKPTDNLVLVGHVDDDAASLEVYGKCASAVHRSACL